MKHLFKKQEIVPFPHQAIKQETAIVEVRDIKQYLVDEYERSKKLADTIEEQNQELERAQEIKAKYDAALVTLDAYQARLASQEERLATKDQKIRELRGQLDSLQDELNTYKILQTRADITREAIKEEIVADVKKQMIRNILAHKGQLSKTHAVEIIENSVLQEE